MVRTNRKPQLLIAGFVIIVGLLGMAMLSGVTAASGGPPATAAQVWLARYHGSGIVNGNDYAYVMALDSDGNVYVTGGSFGSGPGFDYATVKYDSDGDELWVARYDGSGNSDDRAFAITVDDEGNVYVTGYSYGNGSGQDYVTIKYDEDGDEIWVARYDAGSHDVARALALDGDGNVYVTGYSYGGATGFDYATVKYDEDGVEQWVARYNGPGNDFDVAYSLAADNEGNVYVAGESKGNGTGFDYATVKYDEDGNEEWVARYHGSGDGDDGASSLALDENGNVYVTGASYGRAFGKGRPSNLDYATLKYDAGGELQWVVRYDGPGHGLDVATALAVDGVGNAYVTGFSYRGGSELDYLTIKYSQAGKREWVARYDGPGTRANGSDDIATAVEIDLSGNVYVTGYSRGDGTGFDYATLMYSEKGKKKWVARYDGPGEGNDYAYDIAVDGEGNVYVIGIAHFGSFERRDYTTIKYAADSDDQGYKKPAKILGSKK